MKSPSFMPVRTGTWAASVPATRSRMAERIRITPRKTEYNAVMNGWVSSHHHPNRACQTGNKRKRWSCATPARRLRATGGTATSAGGQGAHFDLDPVDAGHHRVGHIPTIGLPGTRIEIFAIHAEACVIVDVVAFHKQAFASGLGGHADLLAEFGRAGLGGEFRDGVAGRERRLG